MAVSFQSLGGEIRSQVGVVPQHHSLARVRPHLSLEPAFRLIRLQRSSHLFRGSSPHREHDEDFEERLPVSIGLIALLDDVAAIAKVAAASLDDVASQAARAGIKAAGVVIDDAAVTPRYVVGFAAKRELPIVGKIAAGSLRNKLMILLPAALLLSYFLPSAITPLLMLGASLSLL